MLFEVFLFTIVVLMCIHFYYQRKYHLGMGDFIKERLAYESERFQMLEKQLKAIIEDMDK